MSDMDTPSSLAFSTLFRRMTWFYAHCALLVIRLTRNGIKGALRDLIGIRFREVERHKHLAGRNNFRDAQFQVRLPSPAAKPRPPGHAVSISMPARRACSSPATRCGDMRSRIGTCPVFVRVCQCSTVRPVLSTNGNSRFGCSGNGSHSIAEELGFAVFCLKLTVGIEASCGGLRRPCRKRPLHAAALFDHLRNSFRSSRTNVLPKPASTPQTHRFGRLHPGNNSSRQSSLFGDCEKDFEVRSCFAWGLHRAIDFADAPLGVGIRAFFLAPDRGGKNQVRQFRSRRRMKPVLNNQEVKFSRPCLSTSMIGKETNRISRDDPQRANFLG